MKKLSIALALCMMLSLMPSVPLQVQAAAPPEELRGIWVATVLNIDFPKTQGAEAQKQELLKVLDTAKASNLNAVFFQVRPHSDALYKSSIFPWSKVLTGEWGKDPGYDPLAYLIEEGHKRGIQIHAWINPYRVMSGSHDLNSLPSTHPVRINPSLAVTCDDGNTYFDPGNPVAQRIVVDGVKEIVDNYAVDGIHFDDYFYPSNRAFNDATTYALYNGGLSLEDWRRQNTYNLVKAVNDTVKATKKNISFGISPAGIWMNKGSSPLGSDTTGNETYKSHFADTRKWVKDGILDYIAPQIYWTQQATNANYSICAKWWSDVVKGTNVKLYIGHANYKVGDTEAWSNPQEIPNQIAYNRSLGNVSGSIFYNYSYFNLNKLGVTAAVSTLMGGGISTPVVTPPSTGLLVMPEVTNLVVGFPANNYTTNSAKCYIIGSGVKGVPIFLNGYELERTESGHFSTMVELKTGTNTFVFEHGKEKINWVIKRGAAVVPTKPYVMNTPEVYNPLPSSDGYYAPGESFTLSCVAPAGTAVTATLNGTVYQLTPGSVVATQGVKCQKYSASVQMQPHSSLGSTNLGKPQFQFTYKDKTYTKSSAGNVFVYMRDPKQVATVVNNFTIARVSNSSSADRKTPLSTGTQDYVIRETPTYFQLAYGGWILKNDAVVTNEVLRKNVVTALSGITSKNLTTVRWKLPVSPTYSIRQLSDAFEITLHNTYGNNSLLIPTMQSNPLFKQVSFKQTGSDAVYTFPTQKKDWIFGYKISHSNGYFKIEFKNPPTLAAGNQPLQGKVIAVDIGHNWGDPGATGPLGKWGPREADVNAAVGAVLIQKLQALGATVVPTKTSVADTPTRQQTIQAADPILSVSVHHNSSGDATDIGTVFGTETLYSESMSKRFAETVQKNFVASTGSKSRGAKFQGLVVCRVLECPAILVECGFVTNPYEYENLTNSTYIDKEAQGIVNGILEFMNN